MKAPLLLFILITAALGIDALPQEVTKARENASTNADALIGFGFDLYRPHAAQHPGENVALSPVCLASLLDALLAAADGKTEIELRRVQHQEPGEGTPAASFMPASDAASGLVVRQATGIWLSTVTRAKADFLTTLKDRFNTKAETIDFAKADEAAREINAWVAEATENKIPSLVSASEFNEQSRLAAVSALYFKAPWADRFDPAKTKPGTFQTGGGKSVSAPMMQGKIRTRYADWPNGTKALALDFQGGTLTFLALLPRDTAGLSALEASLTPELLRAINGALHVDPVEITLPRFAINASAPPRPLLEGLGVGTLFREADFSRMTSESDLAVSTMNHKVSLAVDETGAEGAAAASAVVMAKGVTVAKQFVADRPFVFVIMQRESLAPLAVGRLANPAPAEGAATEPKSTTRKGAATPRPSATPLGVVTPSPGATPRKR